MSYVLELRGNFDSAPTCWKNFINDFSKRWHGDPEHIEIPNAEIQHFHDTDRELQAQWRAHLVGDNWDRPLDIVFESARDYTFFVLRWS